ncbi:MAG: hypothetical protein KJO12_06760 [Ignavibacteria bacterium]|nr:hypothetical protein [Ignavibacteria bacterium]
MKLIYVVEGHTGTGDGYNSWPVKAFESLVKAVKFVEALTKEYEKIRKQYSDQYCWHLNWTDLNGKKNPLDPNMQVEYTGTHYDYYTIELDDEA